MPSKRSPSKYPTVSSDYLRIHMQKPTAVGISIGSKFPNVLKSSLICSRSPGEDSLTVHGRGNEHRDPEFDIGVTEAILGSAMSGSTSRESQFRGTIVSLLRI